MSWAQMAQDALRRSETVQVRPRGHSMAGRVEDGELVTLAPCDPTSLQVGEVVFVRFRGGWLLHLVKAIQGERVLIGNNRGKTNGWVNRRAVLAVSRYPGMASMTSTPLLHALPSAQPMSFNATECERIPSRDHRFRRICGIRFPLARSVQLVRATAWGGSLHLDERSLLPAADGSTVSGGER